MTTKANAFYFFIFFLIFISGFSAHSKDRKVSSYFYTTLQTGTDSGEWAFKIPKCAQLSAKIYHLIKSNCESHGDYQFCRSKEMAQAENTMTGAKQKFAKAYLIFESKEICEKDRLKYLNEDES